MHLCSTAGSKSGLGCGAVVSVVTCCGKSGDSCGNACCNCGDGCSVGGWELELWSRVVQSQ